jgi:tetratricopeptide (TPR) repeat protein
MRLRFLVKTAVDNVFYVSWEIGLTTIRNLIHRKDREDALEIKYSKKKQEIRKDAFLEFLTQAKEFIQSHSKTITWIGFVLLAVLGGTLLFRYTRGASEQKAQEAFGKAMVAYAAGEETKSVEDFKAVVDNNKSSPQAVYSAFILGNLFLRMEKYDEAITWFTAAISSSASTGFVGADAYEGLAASYEMKGNREEALKFLKKTLADPRVRYRHPALQWKSALLNKDLGKLDDAKRLCLQIVADTISQAAAYKQKAENLIVEIEAVR